MAADNHYGELVAVARNLRMPEGSSGWPYEQLSGAASDELLRQNEPLLERVQILVQRPASVPLEYNGDWYKAHSEEIVALRDLSRVWILQCDRARFKGHKETAAQAVRNVLRLANISRNGGLMTDLLVFNALAGGALDRLRKMRRAMSADVCAEMARHLFAWDGEQESFRTIVWRDAEWERAVELVPAEPQQPVAAPPEDPALAELHRAIAKSLEQMNELPMDVQQNMKLSVDHHTTAVARLLTVELALRAASHDWGAAPETLEALIPEYLPAIPVNPFCEAPMSYRPRANEYDLYFIGPSGVDHQGRFGDWNSVEAGLADVYVDIDDLPHTWMPKTVHSPPWRAVTNTLVSIFRRQESTTG